MEPDASEIDRSISVQRYFMPRGLKYVFINEQITSKTQLYVLIANKSGVISYFLMLF
jgi:hypothetical protein